MNCNKNIYLAKIRPPIEVIDASISCVYTPPPGADLAPPISLILY